MTLPLSIRVMGRADLDRAAGWAAAEGWNPGLSDAIAFQAADPHGFLMGWNGEEPVACISVVRYGTGLGFLGFYIATPAGRGKGHGYAVWQAGMRHLAGRNVGLDGVPAQQENYRKSGFDLYWRNIRYTGAAPQGSAAGLIDARTLPFDRIAAYDRRFFPEGRDAFLSAWLGLPGHKALAVLREGDIAGLGVIRPCRTGAKIGPLYASDRGTADRLVLGLCAGIEGPVSLDLPEPHADAVKLATGFGWQPAFETARMYTGPEPAIDKAGLYGITTYELG